MDIVIFCFINNSQDNRFRQKKCEVSSMCKILKELHNKSSEEILEKYGLKGQFPVDIADIAQKIGITLGSMDFREFEKKDSVKDVVALKGHILGFVRAKGDDVFIAYHNSLDDTSEIKNLSEVDRRDKLVRRQRFTIAHEIAHCCLHLDPNKDGINIEYRTEQKDYTNGSREREANIFAGELLIPLNTLTNLCMLYGNRISISLFADIYKVSNHVMEARIAYLQEKGYFANVKIFT